MITERVRWQGWDALRCTAGEAELIVGISAGPRVLSLRRGGGPNLLALDPTDFRVGDWRLYGGHRFSLAPEGPQSYVPDNRPCLVTATGEEVRVSPPIEDSGLRRTLVLAPAADGVGFNLDHELRNHSSSAWTGALWAITCVPVSGPIVSPCRDGAVRFWPQSDPTPWTPHAESVVIVAKGTRGKAGWHSTPAWLASLQAEAALVVHAPDTSSPADCVDGGSNLEVFTCADYVELETLGPRVTVLPGRTVHHRQRWRVLPPIYAPRDWAALAQDAGCHKSSIATPFPHVA